MSKAIKQLLVAAAVIAISMVFIIQFQPGANVDSLKGSGIRCAVEVGGDCIPYSDYVTAYRLMLPRGLDEDQVKRLRLEQVAVDGLIERHVLLKDAERLGITASSEEVARHIAKTSTVRFSLPADKEDLYTMNLNMMLRSRIWLPPPYGPSRAVPITDPKTGKFDYERYQKWVQTSSGKTEKDFKEYQLDELVAFRVRQLVRSRVHVSESEAREKYNRSNQKVVVDYVRLEREYYQRYAIDGSEEAVDTWVGEHEEEVDAAWDKRKDDYVPGCRDARHILVRIDETIPDKAQAKAAAKAALEAAKKRVEGGESFADVAKDVSQDANSADEGGALGCFAKGKLKAPATDPKIDAAAHQLEAGALSEPIETSLGFHLVKVDRVLDEKEAEAFGRAQVGRELYLQQEADRLAAEGGKAILAAVKEGKSLEEALDTHLSSVLLPEAKEAYEKGRSEQKQDKKGDDEKDDATDDEGGDDGGEDGGSGDEATNAWTDPARPQAEVSSPFSVYGPPFAQVEDPPGTARILHGLKKPGDVHDDVIKLVEGYAIAKLKERKPVSDEEWAEKRDEEMERIARDKERDALIHYVQRLKQEFAQEVTLHVGAKKSETAPTPSATATGEGS